MTIFIIILIIATAGVAFVTFHEGLSKNKLIKYGSYVVYFILTEIILFAVTDGIELPLAVFGAAGLIAVVVFFIYGSFFVSTLNKAVRIFISILFVVVTLVAGYFLYESIMTPIRFDNAKHERYQAAVNELKRIRTAQKAFKDETGKFTPHLDTLKKFIMTDSLTVIKKEGTVPDSIYLQQDNNLEKAERVALKMGIIKRDTIRIAIADTLFKNYDFDKFGIVPYTDGYKFEMDTATVDAGGMKINVFEAKVPNLILLNGLDKQLILNLNDKAIKTDRYPGLKVGSLEENNNNEGNWEKIYDLKK